MMTPTAAAIRWRPLVIPLAVLIAVLGFVVGAGSAAGSSENPAGSAVSTVDALNTG
jgi:hypothetical protein